MRPQSFAVVASLMGGFCIHSPIVMVHCDFTGRFGSDSMQGCAVKTCDALASSVGRVHLCHCGGHVWPDGACFHGRRPEMPAGSVAAAACRKRRWPPNPRFLHSAAHALTQVSFKASRAPPHYRCCLACSLAWGPPIHWQRSEVAMCFIEGVERTRRLYEYLNARQMARLEG